MYIITLLKRKQFLLERLDSARGYNTPLVNNVILEASWNRVNPIRTDPFEFVIGLSVCL